jgi:hypothetical protein
MWRRIAVATSLVFVTIMSSATPASAICLLEPLDDLIKTSDAVWLATVIDAGAAPRRGPGPAGGWKLTVRLDDVLKGPGVEGADATVYRSSCGPYISREAAKEMAPSFVGQQRLLIGSIRHGGALVEYSGIVSPQERSTQQQYARALAVLGLSPDIEGPPTDKPSQNSALWLGVGAAALVLTAGAALFVHRRRGSERA